MEPGRLIFLDLLLNLIVNRNFLAVNDFFYSLAVLVLAGNLSSHLNGLIVVFLSYGHGDQALGNLADFLSPCLCSNDTPIVQKGGNLISQKRLSLTGSLSKFSISCHCSFLHTVWSRVLRVIGLTKTLTSVLFIYPLSAPSDLRKQAS